MSNSGASSGPKGVRPVAMRAGVVPVLARVTVTVTSSRLPRVGRSGVMVTLMSAWAERGADKGASSRVVAARYVRAVHGFLRQVMTIRNTFRLLAGRRLRYGKV
jgi:hypothetical protein